MNLDDLLRQPWFYKSPSPLSLIFHGILILWGARQLLKRVEYKRLRWVNALTDSFFLMGFIILSMDAIWMGLCAIRFLGMYRQDLWLVLTVLGRDFTGMLLCYSLVERRIHKDIIVLKDSTYLAYLLLIGFFITVFMIAPDPTWTDWTFAIRQGCGLDRILLALVVPFGLGKAISVLVIWAWWKP